jgi:SAM-dependent methyltransferase
MQPLGPALRQGWRLFLVGTAALFWELVLIRWLGSSIRVVAYYTNFILIAAFFGLGTGALLARRKDLSLDRWLFVALTLCGTLGAALGGVPQRNLAGPEEYVWRGNPVGIVLQSIGFSADIPAWFVLALTYAATVAVFLMFGQRIGRLFGELPPLRAYSFEVAGSLCGILLFALLSRLRLPPVVWFAIGFALLAPFVARRRRSWIAAGACALVGLAVTLPASMKFIWSPYYRILIEPVTSIFDRDTGQTTDFGQTVGYALTVNNDYHQMALDLSRGSVDHPFIREWRELYDAPYADVNTLPPGPILVVGSGTGNDVSAALRNTDRLVTAVEIDPVILDLGRRLHFEHPYDNPRVRVVNWDARSFFETTHERFAMAVFGFLDSHTLLSSMTSVRLDNFVYTQESLAAVRRLLVPGGRVALTFASKKPWIHERLQHLVSETFSGATDVSFAPGSNRYANGTLYKSHRPGDDAAPAVTPPPAGAVRSPTDDWPFLYLESPGLPLHYRIFMVAVILPGILSLLLLPKGSRSLRFPYFFLGAAFFLVETSNVVSLSLLFGSTWTVNVLVFAGILTLVLLGNLTVSRLRRVPLWTVVLPLTASVLLAWAVPTSSLLSLESILLRDVLAVAIFLGPVYFAAVLFASLIREEPRLDEAYGSNLLGTVVGGACEYLSMVLGFKFLLLITLGFYLAAAASVRLGRST